MKHSGETSNARNQRPGSAESFDCGRHPMPMIFITAFPNARVRTQALEADAFGFLDKPFDEKNLIACLDKL